MKRIFLHALVLAAASVSLAAQAPKPVADYLFQNNLFNTGGSGEVPLSLIGTNAFVAESVGGNGRFVSRFSDGDGLAVIPSTNLISSEV